MEKISQKPTVVFVCEHGAAKSIIAAAYFNKAAQERGLDHYAIARGTSPDAELSQTAVIGLRKDGLTPDVSTPQQLSSEELQKASQIIAFCKLPESYGYYNAIDYWDDVPPVSEDYEKARDSILIHIKHLFNFQ
jgi:arsenate reductase